MTIYLGHVQLLSQTVPSCDTIYELHPLFVCGHLAEVARDCLCTLGGHTGSRGQLQWCHPQTSDVTIYS